MMLFFNFLGLSFDHADRFFGSGHDQIQAAIRGVRSKVGLIDVLAIDQTNSNSGDRVR